MGRKWDKAKLEKRKERGSKVGGKMHFQDVGKMYEFTLALLCFGPHLGPTCSTNILLGTSKTSFLKNVSTLKKVLNCSIVFTIFTFNKTMSAPSAWPRFASP